MIIAMRESTTRRRAASWSFTGNHYLTSDGSAGSYADAATTAPALIFLPGSVLGTGTFLCWARNAALGANETLMYAAPGSGSAFVQVRLLSVGSGTLWVRASDDAAVITTASQGSIGAALAAGWVLIAGTWNHGASDVVKAYAANAAVNTATDASPGAYAAATGLRLLSDTAGSNRVSGDIRSPAVFSRVLSDAELAELHTLGPTHDLSVASGNYTGAGPVHWWPADGDSGTTVTDRGSVGGCDLTLNGGVTIEEA